MAKKILIIDDDPDVQETLKLTLEWAGYEAVTAGSGMEGLESVRHSCPDLVLLDVMMPVMNGWQVCRQLRKITDVPIIMITVVWRERDRARGLRLGADDYVVKPWSNRELIARFKAVLRRANTSLTALWQESYSCGDLAIDLVQRQVTLGDKKIDLTPLEYHLLSYLARRPGWVVPCSELVTRLWGTECPQLVGCLRVHVHNLRQKIEKTPRNPQYLLGKHGVGYYLAGQVS
jgi:DNA-binding response OmpR family regulator